VNCQDRAAVISLADVGASDISGRTPCRSDYDTQLSVSASFVANDKLYYMANGVQASYVEVDCDTGFIRILGPMGGRRLRPGHQSAAGRRAGARRHRAGHRSGLFEECVYSEDANLLNGTMADYLVPMANEMPDIVVAHVETPETSTKLGAKGIGEAGLIGAMGSVWVAVNDALKPLGAKVLHQPFTPERVLDALARARDAKKQRGIERLPPMNAGWTPTRRHQAMPR
jgi:carbon-monoxide dehydrogenase large subunit